MQRAALTQSALAKERREIREQQAHMMMDTIPRDLHRSWEDPMAGPGDRFLAAELRGMGAVSSSDCALYVVAVGAVQVCCLLHLDATPMSLRTVVL